MNLNNPAALAAFLKGDIDNAIVAGTPGGIEAQEAAGQRTLVSNFNRLPKNYIGRDGRNFPRELLERLGFKIGGEVDVIFYAIEAPDGWTMKPTDHSMHSDVLDDKGRRRMGVFYKAAFYDRNAHFHFTTRYVADVEYRDDPSRDWDKGERRSVVKDGDTILHAEPWLPNGEFKQHDATDQKCERWLDERYPAWRSPEAYW